MTKVFTRARRSFNLIIITGVLSGIHAPSSCNANVTRHLLSPRIRCFMSAPGGSDFIGVTPVSWDVFPDNFRCHGGVVRSVTREIARDHSGKYGNETLMNSSASPGTQCEFTRCMTAVKITHYIQNRHKHKSISPAQT